MTINIDALREAIAIKEEIARLEARLARVLGGNSSPAAATAAAPEKKKKKRKMSAVGRARIAAAQKKRWAALKQKA